MSSENIQENIGPGEQGRHFLQQPVVILAEVVPSGETGRPPRSFRPRVRLPLLLFIATCLSTLYVGGWVYALSLMTILICHEAGHYLQARRYGVPASLPFFLPMPFSPIGTLGAVIGMDARVSDRKALFDIGITGPLAGLVPTLVFCILGLYWSAFGEAPPLNDPGTFRLGESLLFGFLANTVAGAPAAGKELYLHPMALAGWVGMLITALNLIPIGQLDGGHVLYGLLRDKAHHVASGLLFAAMAAIVFFSLWQWWLMVFLLILMGPKHPPTANDYVSLGGFRTALGWLTLAFVPLGFTPIPFFF